MGAYKLEPEQDTLFVNGPTDTASTQVRYEAPWPISVWRRIDADPWTQENLIAGASSAQQAAALERRGTRTTPALKAGQIIEYGILNGSGIDPNRPGFSEGRWEARTTVYVLLSASPAVNLITHESSAPGGTFFSRAITTSAKTRVRMQVGREEPEEANGYQTMNAPLVTVTSPLSLTHSLESVPLVPGTGYFALSRISDETGQWQFKKDSFTTKKRRVAIQFRKFKVHNDSDEGIWGAGDEVEIFFKVFNGQTQVNEFKWGPNDITDEDAGSEVFLSFTEAVVGPDPFDGVDPGVGLGLKAVERDWFFWIESTDEAEFRQTPDRTIMFITFPTGSGQENVSPPTTATNLEISASPIGGDGSLHLTAHVRHVVSYE